MFLWPPDDMRRCCAEMMLGPAGAELHNTGTRQRVGGGARCLGIRHKVSTGVQHQGYTNLPKYVTNLCHFQNKLEVSNILLAQTCVRLQKKKKEVKFRPASLDTLHDWPLDCLAREGKKENHCKKETKRNGWGSDRVEKEGGKKKWEI